MTVAARRSSTHTNGSTLRAATVKRLLRERGLSIADVGRHAGVDRSIASRIVNRRPVICSVAQRERVRASIAELTK